MANIEERIVSTTIDTLKNEGWTPLATHDGEEWNPTTTKKDMMAEIFDLELSTAAFYRDGITNYVTFITGNGKDIITDFTTNGDFESVMNDMIDYSETF